MHKPLKHSMMYSLATVKTHIHRYLKHIYHSTHSLWGSPTYPYITHATTLLWWPLRTNSPVESLYWMIWTVMAFFHVLIFHAAIVRDFSSRLLTKLFPTSVFFFFFSFVLGV